MGFKKGKRNENEKGKQIMVIQINKDGKLNIYLSCRNGACIYDLHKYTDILMNPEIKKQPVFRLRKKIYENNIEIINNYLIDIGFVNEINNDLITWNYNEEIKSKLSDLINHIYNDLIVKKLVLYHDQEGNLCRITYTKNNLLISINRQLWCIRITIKEIIHKNKN